MIHSRPTSLFRCIFESFVEREECRAFTCSRVDVCILLGGFSNPLALLSCSWFRLFPRLLAALEACAHRLHRVVRGRQRQHKGSEKTTPSGSMGVDRCRDVQKRRRASATPMSMSPTGRTSLYSLKNCGVVEQVPHTICASGHGYLRNVCGAVNLIALRLMCRHEPKTEVRNTRTRRNLRKWFEKGATQQHV